MALKFLAWERSLNGVPSVWPMDSLGAAIILLAQGQHDELPTSPMMVEVVDGGFTKLTIQGDDLERLLEIEWRKQIEKGDKQEEIEFRWWIVAFSPPFEDDGERLEAKILGFTTRQEAEDNLEDQAEYLGLIPGSRIEVLEAVPRETP